MKKITLALCVLCATIFSFTEAKQQKRIVTVWSFGLFNCDEWKMRKDDIDKKFNIDLKIELLSPKNFLKRFTNAMSGSEKAPDIIDWMIENNRILYSDPDKSFVIPLNKYIDKYGLAKKVIASRFSSITYSGNIYGLPHDAHSTVLVYNDTVWKRAGVDVSAIETWDEFFEEAKKLLLLKKNGMPVHFALSGSNMGLADSMFMIWQQTEIPIVTKDGKPDFNSPQFIEFVKKWVSWAETGTMTPWEWTNFSNQIADGTIASYIAPDWWVSQSDAAAKKGKYSMRIRNLPVYKKGMKCGSSWGGSFLAIPKGTKDPEKIFQIMNFMQYDKDAVIERYKNSGMIPPLKNIWNHKIFNQKDIRFENAQIARIQIKSAENLPEILMADHFWNYLADFGQQYNEYYNEKHILFDEMIQNAQNNAMIRFNSKIDPYEIISSDIANDGFDDEEPEETTEEDVYDN